MSWTRAAWIAGLFVVAVFFIWRVSCNCAIQPPPQTIQSASQGQAGPAALSAQNTVTAPATKSPAQYPGTEQVLESDIGALLCWADNEYPGDLPILTALFAAVIAWWSAYYFTGRVKRIDATLDFSKRFHELIQRQDALNRKYAEDQIKLEEERSRNPPDRFKLMAVESSLKCCEKESVAWWWQFFDLVLHEFDFWRRGLVREERFDEWMMWRWHDAHPKADMAPWTTGGIGYMDGWRIWRSHPAHGNRLIDLLDEIHKARNPKEVPAIVAKYRQRLRDDVARDNIKIEPGEYLELATNQRFTVN